MTELPPIDWPLAARTGGRLAPVGPPLTVAERRDAVASLRAIGREAHGHAVAVTDLPDPGGPIPVEVVGRARWIELNTQTAERLITSVADVPARPDWTLADKVQARALATQVAPALAWISGKIIGQFDPFAATPALLLIAPNVLQVERELGVDPRDFRLWVAVHEQTHRLQFHAAPWLPGRLRELLGRAVTPDAPGERSGDRPASVIDLFSGPGQRAVLDDVTALMSVLEGYAEVMMNRVGPDVIPTVEQIRPRFQARRARGGVDAVMRRALGMDAKLAQYRDGADFCAHVLGHAGLATLNRVYSSPAAMPSYAELKDPASWLRRLG